MIVELALATNIAPSVWAAESTEVIATALTILEERK
ncbi:hypothetical protein SEA_LAILA_14 [Arthrobacter phage Laila]|nr:hypothetical protein SEA_LAILA_14 [Arthrobacter phage Laila]QGH75248.1 hypothetical protein SEA_SAPHIRA_13 [Arthrobacter phage Saphira]